MFRGRQENGRSRQMRAELEESMDHALRAAGHAAGGIRATMGPRVAPTAGKVRAAASERWGSTKSALAPLSEAAQTETKQNGKRAKKARAKVQRRQESRRRRSGMAALLASGVAVGAAAAMVMRWRRQQQWEDYAATGVPEATELTEVTEVTETTATGADRQSAAGRPDGATGRE